MVKRVFSGVQPSGNLHIGNYLSVIKQWVDLQDQYDNIFCIVDLHAITVPQDPVILRQKIKEISALYFAAGIDPKKSNVFIQSHVPAHTELAWILNCVIPFGWMGRMTQFKEKSAQAKDSFSTGLFDYPALMAADILLYDTDIVPVGEDQKQHVELTRDAAERFNHLFSPTFKLPNVLLRKTGARIMSLINPEKKMSKSDENKDGAILLLDSPDEIQRKIAKATTDSFVNISFDPKRVGIYNLITIYHLFTGLEPKEIEDRYQGKGYADFKRDLADIIIEELKPLQENYSKLMANPDLLNKLLQDGENKVKPLAEAKLKEVKEKVGLG